MILFYNFCNVVIPPIYLSSSWVTGELMVLKKKGSNKKVTF